MDQLALQSTFAKVRNPYGLRRWAHMVSSDNPTVDFRVPQVFGKALQPYAEDNKPLLVTRVRNGETLAQVVPFRDNWERPAQRWFKAVLTTVGTTRVVFATAGTPFQATDPFQTSVVYQASPGDDLFLDDGAGNVYDAKVSTLDPTGFPGGNAVEVTSKAGASLPADGTYYVQHTLDAFYMPLTVSYMIPATQASTLDPGTFANPFQSVLQLTYYDNAGATVVEQYRRVPIKELSTIVTDVPYAFIDVVGDRFGVASNPAPGFIQIFETFEAHLARVPDKLEVVFDNTGPGSGGISVDVGNVALYYGLTVPALATVPPNILPPNPNPAPTPRYNLYPPPDPEDFWTGSGDIVVMPTGTVCPAGYEDIGQILSRANDHFVRDSATGQPITFALSNGTDLQMSLVNGNTVFTGTIPATAEDPSHPGVSLRSASNNTSTFEIVFLMSRFNGAFRDDQSLAFRIPALEFDSAGGFTFTLSGDVRQRVGNSLTSALDCRLFISGIVLADDISNAGQYSKPVQTGEDAAPIDNAGAAFAPYATRLSLPLDDVLVNVGDIIVFLNEDLSDASEIDTGGAVFTGPSFVVKDVGPSNSPSDIPADPLGDNEIVVIDKLTDDGVAGRATQVWRFVGDSSTPSVPQSNLFKVLSASTNHTHAVGVGDAEVKSRKDGGHFVTNVDHTHIISSESLIAPYVKMKLCVKL